MALNESSPPAPKTPFDKKTMSLQNQARATDLLQIHSKKGNHFSLTLLKPVGNMGIFCCFFNKYTYLCPLI